MTTSTQLESIARRLNATYGPDSGTSFTNALTTVSLAASPTTRHDKPVPTNADVLDALRIAVYARIAVDHSRLELIGFLRANGVSWDEIGWALGRTAWAVMNTYGRLRRQFPGWTPPSPAEQGE